MFWEGRRLTKIRRESYSCSSLLHLGALTLRVVTSIYATALDALAAALAAEQLTVTSRASMDTLSDRLYGIQRTNQANLAAARSRAVQRGLKSPNTAPWRTQGSMRADLPSSSPPMRPATIDARSIAELCQVSQQITNRINATRQGARPQSYAPATDPRSSPQPVWTSGLRVKNPYYQKFGHRDCREQLNSVDNAIEETLEQLDEIAHRLNSRLARRPSIDELQQRGVMRCSGAPQLAAAATALERAARGWQKLAKRTPVPCVRAPVTPPHPHHTLPCRRPNEDRLTQRVPCPASKRLGGTAGGHHQGSARRRATQHRGCRAAKAVASPRFP